MQIKKILFDVYAIFSILSLRVEDIVEVIFFLPNGFSLYIMHHNTTSINTVQANNNIKRMDTLFMSELKMW